MKSDFLMYEGFNSSVIGRSQKTRKRTKENLYKDIFQILRKNNILPIGFSSDEKQRNSFIIFTKDELANEKEHKCNISKFNALIFLRNDLPAYDRIFLTCYELGHYFLHSSIPFLEFRRRNGMDKRIQDEVRKEASVFAVWFLFPNSFLEESFKTKLKKTKISNKETFWLMVKEIHRDMFDLVIETMSPREDRHETVMKNLWDRIIWYIRSEDSQQVCNKHPSLKLWCRTDGCHQEYDFTY